MTRRDFAALLVSLIVLAVLQGCDTRCAEHGDPVSDTQPDAAPADGLVDDGGMPAERSDAGKDAAADASSVGGEDAGVAEGHRPPADDIFNGIGWPCHTDADCNPGTYCDEEERYCTTPCETHDDCRDRFGGFTKCLPWDLCGAECADDDDCNPFMECNDYTSYCYRAGTS